MVLNVHLIYEYMKFVKYPLIDHEYFNFKERIESFENLFKKIEIFKNKYSKMIEEFDEFIRSFYLFNSRSIFKFIYRFRYKQN